LSTGPSRRMPRREPRAQDGRRLPSPPSGEGAGEQVPD